MIKFEEHDGLIFKMLNKPLPLTPETEMPCLVRLIQDDSPMGLHNKDLHGYDSERFTPRICTEVIDVNDLSDPNRGGVRYDGYISGKYYRFEIIGIHVKEGSGNWAWHMMQEGYKTMHCESTSQRFYAIREGNNYCAFYDNEWKEVDINTRRNYCEFIEYAKAFPGYGWRILKEPREEPKLPKEQKIDSGEKEYTCLVCGKKMSRLDGMAEVSIKRISISSLYESTLSHYCGSCFLKLGFDATEKELRSRQQPNPEPTFKVGDWVKYDIDSYLQVIEPSGKERTLCRTLSGAVVGVSVYPCTSLLTKASPSEVVVRIGCLSGTVRRINDIFFCLNPSTKKGWVVPEATIPLAMLDTTTAELVRELLKAQEKGE